MTEHIIFRAKEYPDFTVDRAHGLLLNTNQAKLEAYHRERKRLQESQINNHRLSKLEQDLADIKQLLQDLLNHGN